MTRQRKSAAPAQAIPNLTTYLNRANDTWYVNVYWPETKRRERYSLRVHTEEDAQAALRDFEAHILPELLKRPAPEAQQSAQSPSSRDPSVRAVCDHYTETYLPNKGAAAKTLAKAEQELYEFHRFCSMHHVGRASQLSPAIVDAWVAQLRKDGLAPKTIHNRLGMLRAMLNAAVDRDMLTHSPIRKWLMPALTDPEIQPLTPEGLAAVSQAVHEHAPRVAAAVDWMILTGNRPSDTAALQVRQVDLDSGLVTRPQVKTRRLAQYEICPEAIALVRAAIAAGAKANVFRDYDGEPLSVHELYKQFQRALRAADFPRPVTLKDLRHSFGTNLANADPPCPLPVLQRLMGHKDIQTTMRYVKSSDGGPFVQAYGVRLGIGKSTENTCHPRHQPKNARKSGRK
ncbi:MAG: site-specific integrase [Candidatus Hydrogenedentes bacterium]|nr:site-specific integrase [Candidatus Hydrogenedentota bacterium]